MEEFIATIKREQEDINESLVKKKIGERPTKENTSTRAVYP